MLKRSCPRSSTSFVTANGNSETNIAPFLPVKKAASVCSVPRATVPSTSGRALDPLLKKSLDRSGRYFGWLCMSCRQPVSAMTDNAAAMSLVLDFIDLSRSQGLEKLERLHAVELRIRGLDREEQLVLARANERRHVEDRVIRHRQPV